MKFIGDSESTAFEDEGVQWESRPAGTKYDRSPSHPPLADLQALFDQPHAYGKLLGADFRALVPL
jgi:hypothetical protein